MLHLQEMMKNYDMDTERMLKTQLTDPRDPRRGAFLDSGYTLDTRSTGFAFAHLAISYLSPVGRYYLSETLAESMRLALAFLRKYQRPDGCLDLSDCNFASPPDTAFTMNAVLNGWTLLEKETDSRASWLREPMKDLLISCGEGIAAGGFHTPNHRWAISSCLKTIALLADRPDFSARADQYLNEGLDINEDGEFAERSTGCYNKVNCDQMIRLYLATGEKRFLEAARANLTMSLCYIDPDESIFTNNSTRQDYGTKAWLEGYYILFKLTGYLLNDPSFAAYGEYCYDAAVRHGMKPEGVAWLLRFPDLDAFGNGLPCDMAPILRCNRLFPASGIARMRKDNLSLTLMSNKANFLYFQVESMPVYMVIYSNLCDRRNFIASSMEAIENGYRLKAHANSWYYKPFWPETPETSDWWAMDNPHTRERYQGVPLDTEVTAELDDEGVTVHVKASGITELPLRIELGFPAPCRLRHESFLMDGNPGGSLVLAGGNLEVTGPAGETVTVEGGFAEHAVTVSRGGAYPRSEEHFTVYLTAYTPVDKTFRLSIRPFAKKDLLPY